MTHNNEAGPVPETEDDMFIAIMEYLDRVFACVRPRKVLYMAIDGVAPRAKMNQQRARRFRSAQERQENIDAAEELRAKLRAEGVDVPDAPEEPPFDSNVITPGTRQLCPPSLRLCVFVLFCFFRG